MYARGSRSPSLAFYRQNQAINRNIYKRRITLAGMGDPGDDLPTITSIAPTTQPLTAYENIATKTPPPGMPLDYASPQAAVAAGLDPTEVFSAWSAAVAQFPTANAAVDAGVPAGVVTELWAGPPPPVPVVPWWKQNFMGLPKGLWAGSAAFLAFAVLTHKGEI